MPQILQLDPHVANMIAAGEVVERPASVAKELLENAVDAGASQVTIEIRDGGMTFLRVTDNGCGMAPSDARTAFPRHATSKLRKPEDLAAIGTMGFRGEALAAIASVSRIDLLTKTPGSLSGTSLHLEAGVIMEESEAGCPDGTTIIIRDLFYNTPARMKFMKSDTVEASRITAALQMQALAHPEVSITLIRDGKNVLQTPGTGALQAAVYSIYGSSCAKMLPVESKWEGYSLTGFVSRPTDARPSRSMQTFFVNDRPVKSTMLIKALEEAYRNMLMQGKFPACVLHIKLPAAAVDVNVHPAKTEVKFLNEKAVFDCVHYGVLGALNKTPDRPAVKFAPAPTATATPSTPAKLPDSPMAPPILPVPPVASPSQPAARPKQESFFRTMTAEEFKNFSTVMQDAPQPSPKAAAATLSAVSSTKLRQDIVTPAIVPPPAPMAKPIEPVAPVIPVQEELPIPETQPWRLVGELYRSYVLVEQGDDAFLIDKHAAHERILFEKLKANQETISAQSLLAPIPVRLSPEACGELLANTALLEELGFEVGEFGENTLALRQIPMDLSPEDAAETLETIAEDLLSGRREDKLAVRDEILHTVACKAAIKAGWRTSDTELQALVKEVMAREDLKYCPHGRPICISLSKKQLEKQFKRS